MTTTIHTIRHDATGVMLDTSTDTLDSGTEYETTAYSSKLVAERTTSYDGGRFFSRYLHVCTGGIPDPEQLDAQIKVRDGGDRYVVVNIDAHEHLFLPIEIADAIVTALADHKFAEDEKICSEVK
jgi:hypothetical protein